MQGWVSGKLRGGTRGSVQGQGWRGGGGAGGKWGERGIGENVRTLPAAEANKAMHSFRAHMNSE